MSVVSVHLPRLAWMSSICLHCVDLGCSRRVWAMETTP